jgi:hypothetical protein
LTDLNGVIDFTDLMEEINEMTRHSYPCQDDFHEIKNYLDGKCNGSILSLF